ncbi:hypothetical protein TSUD_222480 [Trifolium subterraneum]|uniref:DUF4219 domain-containing protein n=1 Tax=Trifolium subterraneum TaxID=3900 RepID=A0A2Z6MQE7_TRISU|nr:hypothetical protein TSUD_222480 [Trifolium subterraneum]
MVKSTAVASGGIVHQVLTKDNYERWRGVMQNYLQGQGLWDDIIIVKKGVVDTDKPIKDPDLKKMKDDHQASKKMKDGKTFHIFQLSLGREQHENGLESKANPDIEQVVLDDSFGPQHKELFRKVTRGDYIGNIINSISDVYLTSSTSVRTFLHVAVIAGNVDNVKMLMAKGKERLLLMQDKHGDTALSLVARYTGNTDMAKCMIETKHGSGENLLEMQNKENIIPILMAAANGHKELTTYLYSKTPNYVFEGDDPKSRILLLSLCITAEIFDVALKLLKRYKDLPKESLSSYNFSVPKLLRESLSLPNKILELNSNQQPLPDKFSALVALAKMPSAFPSGNQFSRREQFIYDSKFLQLIL